MDDIAVPHKSLTVDVLEKAAKYSVMHWAYHCLWCHETSVTVLDGYAEISTSDPLCNSRLFVRVSGEFVDEDIVGMQFAGVILSMVMSALVDPDTLKTWSSIPVVIEGPKIYIEIQP